MCAGRAPEMAEKRDNQAFPAASPSDPDTETVMEFKQNARIIRLQRLTRRADRPELQQAELNADLE
jgi:hypothetical protein